MKTTADSWAICTWETSDRYTFRVAHKNGNVQISCSNRGDYTGAFVFQEHNIIGSSFYAETPDDLTTVRMLVILQWLRSQRMIHRKAYVIGRELLVAQMRRWRAKRKNRHRLTRASSRLMGEFAELVTAKEVVWR